MTTDESSGSNRHVVITGGAGYIGSVVVGTLLRRGEWVTVVDNLLFGGESLLAYFAHPRFHFARADVSLSGVLPSAAHEASQRGAPALSAVVHLAAISGFPACEATDRETVWGTNVEAVCKVFQDSEALGVGRFIFSSTYSNYGRTNAGAPVTEESPLNPQSFYAETKIAAERFLLHETHDAQCAPLVFRFATVFGVSPRMRFDLIINEFVKEAYTRGELLVFQRGYSRSFIHVRDVAEGIRLALDAPPEKIKGQVYNLGSDDSNYTKDEIVALILKVLPETQIRYENLTYEGDMRDIRVSFAKVRERLGFRAQVTVPEGIEEILFLLQSGIVRDPDAEEFRNAKPIVQ